MNKICASGVLVKCIILVLLYIVIGLGFLNMLAFRCTECALLHVFIKFKKVLKAKLLYI